MRSVSASALATLKQPYGVEPVTLLKVYWTPTNVIWYGEKSVPPTVKGAILEMSAFDDVVNFDGNKATQTFNITLDDVDGTIKAIYNTNDIHKRRVDVYQWFTGIPLADAFLVFEGEINSPIVWKEGERTISFAVVSQIEEQEVGFAPEEGIFDSIPDELVGKPFPLIFGIARNVPCIKQDPIPTGILLDTMAVPDPSISKQIIELMKKIQEFGFWATMCFYAAIEAYDSGVGTAEDGEGGILGIDDYWQNLGDGFVAQGNQYLQQMWKAQQQIMDLSFKLAAQKKFGKKTLRIHNGECFPQGGDASATLDNGTKITGTFAGTDFQINGVIHPGGEAADFGGLTAVPIAASADVGGNTRVVQKLGMIWEPADQPFKLENPLPITYIACMLTCNVLNVWAYRNYNDTRLLMQVPTEYYTVGNSAFGSMPITTITLAKPLSYYDSKWDDSLYADLQSGLGPNTVSILIWMIENYTTKGIDGASFGHVAARVSGAPANFAMMKQENIIKVLSDIAYQSRCALILKNDVFFLKYLPDQPIPVDTITLDDIVVNTLEINHSSTENLITKMVADWVPSYEGGKTHKIIIRNNTGKYGIHEQATNWYIYTDSGLVDVSVSFWAIRKSNTWKRLKFKTPLHKIRLESFDAVTINFASDYACIGSVIGIVESVKLNTKELNLEFEVWLPVRLGEMTKYNFAWPVDSDVAVNPGNLDFQKIGYDANGDLGPTNGLLVCNQSGTVQKKARQKTTHPTPHTSGNGVILAPSSAGLDPTPQPNIPYDYDTPRDPAPFEPASPIDGAYPATISRNDDSPTYRVRAYTRGLDNRPRSIGSVLDVTGGPKLAVGTWVTLLAITWTEDRRDQNAAGGQGRRQLQSAKYLVPSAARNTFVGKVTGGGSDGNYTVVLYSNGITNPPDDPEITVKQLQIATGDIVPVDTWVFVVLNIKTNPDGTTTPEYTMQVPIYLGG